MNLQIAVDLVKRNSNIEIHSDPEYIKHLYGGTWVLMQYHAGYTNPAIHAVQDLPISGEIIFINTTLGRSDCSLLKSFFHELGHATGTSDRLNRKLFNENRSPFAEDFIEHLEELVAETVADNLMLLYGLHNSITIADTAVYRNCRIKRFPIDERPIILDLSNRLAREAQDYILSNWLKNISQEKAA